MNPDISEATDVESQGVKRMRADVKAQWVAALRSGEYKQGRSHLHNGDGSMCCLGVLSHLAAQEGVCRASQPEEYPGWAYDGQENYPPTSVIEWAGLDDSDPALAPVTDALTEDGCLFWEEASVLNDGGLPFSQIADLIDWAL